MNALTRFGIAPVALALVLVFAAPVLADNTCTTHITILNPTEETGLRFETWVALNGEMRPVCVGAEWVSPGSAATYTFDGSPTVMGGHFLIDLTVTTETGQVMTFRHTDLPWEVRVVTTGTHQDIHLTLRSLPFTTAAE